MVRTEIRGSDRSAQGRAAPQAVAARLAGRAGHRQVAAQEARESICATCTEAYFASMCRQIAVRCLTSTPTRWTPHQDMAAVGTPATPLPSECPWTLDDLLSEADGAAVEAGAVITTTYDPVADVLNVRFGVRDAESDGHQEVAPGVYVDSTAPAIRSGSRSPACRGGHEVRRCRRVPGRQVMDRIPGVEKTYRLAKTPGDIITQARAFLDEELPADARACAVLGDAFRPEGVSGGVHCHTAGQRADRFAHREPFEGAKLVVFDWEPPP